MKTDYIAFYKELARCFPQIGMILPSSRALARSMVEPLRGIKKLVSILEVGPGTGPITREILRAMGPQDTFLICEINPRFMARLKRSLQRNRDFQRHSSRVSFLEGPVQELSPSVNADRFDVIISSLPFYNFHPDTVDEIFQLFEYILKPGGRLTFIEYLVTRQIGSLFSSREHRERVRAVETVIRNWCKTVDKSGEVEKKISFLNVPPALSYHFTYPAAATNGYHSNGIQRAAAGADLSIR